MLLCTHVSLCASDGLGGPHPRPRPHAARLPQTGTLLQDLHDECCKTSASTGPRSSRLKARGLDAAAPMPGNSVADALRKRVDAWRARDVIRRAVQEAGPNMVEQRALKKYSNRGEARQLITLAMGCIRSRRTSESHPGWEFPELTLRCSSSLG